MQTQLHIRIQNVLVFIDEYLLTCSLYFKQVYFHFFICALLQKLSQSCAVCVHLPDDIDHYSFNLHQVIQKSEHSFILCDLLEFLIPCLIKFKRETYLILHSVPIISKVIQTILTDMPPDNIPIRYMKIKTRKGARYYLVLQIQDIDFKHKTFSKYKRRHIDSTPSLVRNEVG